jgi:cytoskeletal protein CcmA (bactofilin family)
MFSKTNPPSPPARQAGEAVHDQRRAAPTRVASVLGPDLVFEGAITGEGELHVEGEVRGELHVARLTVGEHATVQGVIRGGIVEIRGKVIGNIEARQVRLYETAHVDGDIVHEQLSIEAGAFFQGRCQQFQRPVAQVIELDTGAGQAGAGA